MKKSEEEPMEVEGQAKEDDWDDYVADIHPWNYWNNTISTRTDNPGANPGTFSRQQSLFSSDFLQLVASTNKNSISKMGLSRIQTQTNEPNGQNQVYWIQMKLTFIC